MLGLARLATRRPVAVAVVAAAFVILGWTAWRDLPLDLLPDIQSPTIVVAVRSGDRPPSEMERLYGEQVEQRLFAVRGIREVNQVARTGRLIATVTFDWDADMDFALVEVEKAVGPIRSDIDVEEVLVRRFDPRQAPVLTLGLVALPDGPGLAELRRIAERQVAIALERLDGVAEARVTGGRELDKCRSATSTSPYGRLRKMAVSARRRSSVCAVSTCSKVLIAAGIPSLRRRRATSPRVWFASS